MNQIKLATNNPEDEELTVDVATEPLKDLVNGINEDNVTPFKDVQPSNWDIKPLADNGMIEAHNSLSQESFEGTVAEFNECLKG